MKLEQKVTNLEISKRLRELNVKQESLFSWVERTYEPGLVGNNPCVGLVAGEDINFSRYHRVSDKLLASAFTCAELGEMLPQSVEVEGRLGFLTHWKDNISFRVWYETDDEDVRPNDVLLGLSVEADTEADARGKMLIYLIENGLLKV